MKTCSSPITKLVRAAAFLPLAIVSAAFASYDVGLSGSCPGAFDSVHIDGIVPTSGTMTIYAGNLTFTAWGGDADFFVTMENITWNSSTSSYWANVYYSTSASYTNPGFSSGAYVEIGQSTDEYSIDGSDTGQTAYVYAGDGYHSNAGGLIVFD